MCSACTRMCQSNTYCTFVSYVVLIYCNTFAVLPIRVIITMKLGRNNAMVLKYVGAEADAHQNDGISCNNMHY